MSEVKDPAIKLFGKTIQLPEIPVAAAAVATECSGAASVQTTEVPSDDGLAQDRPFLPNFVAEESSLNDSGAEQESDKDPLGGAYEDCKAEDGARSMMSEEILDPDVMKENSGVPFIDDAATPAKTSKTEEEQNQTSNSQDKTLKKPDKILPCPRCNSMDTKFCYYNNYNVNQPRHFCKNCQRYWTAGGTMRNVPVGAGRRKSKNSAFQFRHMTVSETLQNSRPDHPNGINHPTVNPNGTVLTFGSDAPLCESMASVLNIAEEAVRNSTSNGFQKPEDLIIPNSYGGLCNGDDHPSGSSVSAASSKDEGSKEGVSDRLMSNCHSIPPQMPCFHGAPWPYPWNSVQWNPSLSPAAFLPAAFPMPFYPAASYWGCAVPGTWNGPWLTSPAASQNTTTSTSGPTSPTLGKHLRDDNLLKPVNSEKKESQKESNPDKCLWVPKTLRIDDPGEAAKSSIWATLGIKNERVNLTSGRGLFKAFQSKGDEKANVSETSNVLQANPAALSRSLSFHERS